MTHLPFSIDRPYLLLLAPIMVLLFWAVSRRSRAGIDPRTLNLALAVRSIIVVLLLLAASGARWVERTDKLTTIFLLDVSQSIRPDQRAQNMDFIRRALAAKRSGDAAGVVVFGRTPFLENPPSDSLQSLASLKPAVATDATDLSSALKIAESAFPSGTGKKIVLLSDGNENIGAAQSDIEHLRADRVRVDIGTVTGGPDDIVNYPEAMVDSVNLPSRVRQSAPFTVRTVVSSTVPQSATLTVQQDGRPVYEQKVTLKIGKNAFAVPGKIEATGLHRYDATIAPERDSFAENNHAYGNISVQGRPRILYVAGSHPEAYKTLKQAMAVQGIDLNLVDPNAVPSDVASLQPYEGIVLSDVPAAELSDRQMSAIQSGVRDFGLGLGMVGGENSFGSGGYYGTPIEAALPVRMDVSEKRRLPPAAVVIVLDASGSMSATENGVEKVQLGARAALQLMEALQPDDEVAVTSVTTVSTIVVPLQYAKNARNVKDAIAGVSAGGEGIFCYQGLEDAYSLLQRSQAPIKHVIICPDTSDSKQQDGCVVLARQMRDKLHITTTVCGIGSPSDHDVPFQKQLASAGGGQLFIVKDAADLPNLFRRDVQRIHQPLFVEKPFLPRYNSSSTLITGIPFAKEPPLLGYNITTLKPGANLALSAPEDKNPVFASWRYGLGRTFAFTSDERPHWAIQWLPWPGYTQFWSQALRWSLRSSSHGDFQAQASMDGGRGHLTVDAFTPSGKYVNGAQWNVRLAGPDAVTTTVPVIQTGPGHYEGSFAADQLGSYLLNVSQDQKQAGGFKENASQTVALVVPYWPEFRTVGPNWPLLTGLAEGTGGKLESDPAQIFSDSRSWAFGTHSLAPGLIGLVALLFLGDIAIRRLNLRAPRIPARGAVPRIQPVSPGLSSIGVPPVSHDPGGIGVPPVSRDSSGIGVPPVSKSKPPSAGIPSEREVRRVLEANKNRDQLLNRRALHDVEDDDPFPYVVKLPSRSQSAAGSGRDSEKTQDRERMGGSQDPENRARQKDD